MKSYLKKNGLSFFPWITILFFLSSISLGLFSTWLPAFGYLPVIGYRNFTLGPWIDLFHHPVTPGSIQATIISGWGSTFLTLTITLLLFASSYQRGFWKALQKTLAPLLAVPHAAFAIGFLFLVSPSGWILRILSPAVTGFHIPPDWNIIKDSYGISLMLALTLKEVPFLVLMSLGALSQVDVKRSLAVGRSLGYSTGQVWLKVIVPQVYPKIRLSIFAILAYSLSVVDIAQILGPTLPPTLAVIVFNWFADPDLSYRLLGASGATFVFFLVISSIISLYILEIITKKLMGYWLVNGKRTAYLYLIRPLGNLLITIIVGFSFLAMVVLTIWSFTWRWRFPDFLPMDWSARFWTRGFSQIGIPAFNSLSIGLVSSLIAIIIVIGCLENELVVKSKGRRINTNRVLWMIYLPLLVPQIAFLFGVQMTLITFQMDGLWISLVWSHLLFVLPYVFLTLGPVYRSYDQRMSQVAITLCGSPIKVFFKIKLPILLRPLLFSLAIGFSVSIAQYLPTLFIGAGRFDTITTDAVSLASGSDRRIVAVYALFQFLGPFLMFLIALVIPKVLFKNRKEMQLST